MYCRQRSTLRRPDFGPKDGEHLMETAVQETLNDMSGSDVFGFLEIGPTLRRTYFKFAGELIVHMLVRGVPEADKENVFMEKWEKISGLFNSFALIERVLNMYATDRRLLG